MIESPIWSTWARYKRNISDEIVLRFAQEIIDHGYFGGQLEIDDDWEVTNFLLLSKEKNQLKFFFQKGMLRSFEIQKSRIFEHNEHRYETKRNGL